jgi:hypothetical protein
MTDALHLLRDANPQDPARLTLPPSLSAERLAQRPPSRSRRPVRPVALATVFAAVLAVALIVALGGGSGPGLAERAYAATDDPGVAHWRVHIDVFHDGTLSTQQTEEGWAKDATAHVVRTTAGDKPVVTERRTDGGQEQSRTDGGPVISGPAGQTDLERVLPGKDPFAAFRAAYATQRLNRVSDGQFAVAPTAGAPSLVYDIDPSTAAPKRLTETFAGSPSLKVVLTFDAYEILAPTERNLAALAMAA